jgi:hypothetical protein
MVDVVGLRFVTDGQLEALNALRDYQDGLRDLSSLKNKYVATMNAAVAREVQAEKKAAQDIATAQRQRDAEDRAALQRYLRYQREREAAAQREARAAEKAAGEAIRLKQREAQETEALARAYNPLMAATAAYEREVIQLNRAHQLGVLTADQLEAKLAELGSAYAVAGTSAVNATRFMNQYGDGVQIAGIKTNRFGMISQQVGYQVGDFFVQVQSGTNAFVAFGQQATQLAGLLPGLAGAVVGIGISVGTMFLSAWDRSRKSAEAAGEAFDGVRQSLDNLEAVRLDTIGEGFAAAAKAARADFEGLLSVMEAVELRALEAALTAPVQALIDQLIEYERQRDLAIRFSADEPTMNILGQSDPERLIQTIQILNQLQGDTREELQQQLNLIEIQIRGSGLLTAEAQTLIAALATQLGMQESLATETEAAAEAEKERVSAAQAVSDALNAEMTSLLTRQMIAETVLRYGEESAELAQVEAALARETYEAEQMRLGLKEEALAAVMAEYDRTVAIEARVRALPAAYAAASASVDAMNARLGTTLGKIGSILSAIGQIGFGIVAAQAETAALNAGMSQGAARIEGEYAAAIAGGAQTGLAGLANTLQAGVVRVVSQARLAAEEERQAAVAASIASTAGGSDSGGGSVDETTQSIEEMTEAYNRLMGQLDPAIEAAQKMARDTKILTDAYDAGIISTEELAAAQKLLRESVEGDGDESWLVKPLEDFGAALGDLIESGGKDFEGFANRMVSTFSQAIAKMVAEQAAAKLGQMGGMFGGVFGAIAGAAVGFGLGKLLNTDGTPRQDARDAQALQLQTAILEAEGKTNVLRQMVLDKMWAGNHALQERLWLLEDEKRISDEKLGLQQQLWQLTGQTDKLRKLELSTLDKSNRALQKRIWMIEDRRAARALGDDALDDDGVPRDNSERLGLMRRIWELTGQTAKIRRAELLALEPANRELQKRIWALEKEAEAAAKAKAELQAVNADRRDLRRQWYELIGDEQKLREMDLKALDESLHPLQLRIWALQDEREAAEAAAEAAERLADSLTTDMFATLFDYERAVGRARNGGMAPLSTPAVSSTAGSSAVVTAAATGNATSTGSSTDALLAAILNRISRLESLHRKWDTNGLPEERVSA